MVAIDGTGPFTPSQWTKIDPLAGVLVVETSKFTISAVLLLHSISIGSVQTFLMRPTIKWDAALPAFLYTCATLLQSTGAYNLDLAVYLALSQLKVILAPLCATVILKQRYPLHGWVYVLLMTVGIVLCQIGIAGGLPSPDATNPAETAAILHGVASMFLAGISVALESIIMERAIQQSASLLLGPLVLGFNAMIMVYLGLQISGGFLVAWCIQMTSTVTKNYAQGVSSVLAILLPLVWR
ncbi:hypothetical protein BDW66DRAFT_167429 [Aspergillus desertorum]